MHLEYCIIGGGISGLYAAHRLAQAGKTVALIEASRVGGLVKSLAVDGFTLEQGAATLSANAEFLKLCDELQISDRIVYPTTQKYGQYVVFDQKIYQLPRNPALLLKSKLFKLSDKLALLHGVFKKFPAGHFSENLTVADFVEQLFCRAAAERIAAPVLRGIFGGDIQQLKASLVFEKLFNGLNKGFSLMQIIKGQVPGLTKRGPICCLRGGNETLCVELYETIKDQVEIISTKAQRVSYSEESKFKIALDNGKEISTKNLFVATSGKATSDYLSDLLEGSQATFEALRYASIKVIHLAIAKPNTLPESGFGVLFPPRSEAAVLGILYNSKLFPHLAPPGFDLLTVCFGGSDYFGQPVERLPGGEQQISQILKKYLKIKEFRILSDITWPRGIPQYDDNCVTLLELQNKLVERYPGLYFMGSDVGGVGVPARLERVANVVKQVV